MMCLGVLLIMVWMNSLQSTTLNIVYLLKKSAFPSPSLIVLVSSLTVSSFLMLLCLVAFSTQ